MSKKNLARTAIEGGRSGYNKWERRNSHNEERAQERDYCKKVEVDPELADDFDIAPKTRVYKGFTDKLSPMYRWLNSQVGRPWNDVYSEISEKFDTRTTAGRHIINDHLLRSVEITPHTWRYKTYTSTIDDNTSHHKNDYYVDEDGILCKRQYVSRRAIYEKAPAFDVKQIANWLNGRVVGKVGNKLFWFTPVDKGQKYGGFSREWKSEWLSQVSYWQPSGLTYSYLSYTSILSHNKDENGKFIVIGREPRWVRSEPTFRQDRKLNSKELKYWGIIPQYYQTRVLERSPTYPNPPKPNPYSGYLYRR